MQRNTEMLVRNQYRSTIMRVLSSFFMLWLLCPNSADARCESAEDWQTAFSRAGSSENVHPEAQEDHDRAKADQNAESGSSSEQPESTEAEDQDAAAGNQPDQGLEEDDSGEARNDDSPEPPPQAPAEEISLQDCLAAISSLGEEDKERAARGLTLFIVSQLVYEQEAESDASSTVKEMLQQIQQVVRDENRLDELNDIYRQASDQILNLEQDLKRTRTNFPTYDRLPLPAWIFVALGITGILMLVLLWVWGGRRRSRGSSPGQQPLEHVGGAPSSPGAESELADQFEKLGEQFRGQQSRLDQAHESLDDQAEALKGIRSSLGLQKEKLDKLEQELNERIDDVTGESRSAHQKIQVLSSWRQTLDPRLQKVEAAQENQAAEGAPVSPESLASPPSNTPSRVANLQIEQLTLQELWDKAETKLGESSLLDLLESENGDWSNRVHQELPASLDSTLRQDAKDTAEPVRAAHKIVSKLNAIRAYLRSSTKGPLPVGDSSDEAIAKELFKVRDFSFHLLFLLHTEEGASRLNFSLEKWVRNDFRQFADRFYREFWNRKIDGNAESLSEAESIVKKILSWGSLQVIQIHPGRTRFDSTVHIGATTTTRSDYPDGVVMGVVRVGFQDKTTEKTLQKPEVVVNRT